MLAAHCQLQRGKQYEHEGLPVTSHPYSGLWAQAQLDPDLSGTAAQMLDLRYFVLALARRTRFLVEYSLDDSGMHYGTTADLVVSVRLLNERSEPAELQTNVRMEFEYSGDAVYSVGSADTGAATPANHWVARAHNSGDGYYQVAVHPEAGWAAGSVGVAVLDGTKPGEFVVSEWEFPANDGSF